MTPRTVYLHGRPSHPFHQRLARSLDADFLVKDFLLRWHDYDAPRLRRYASWLLCTACFPQRDAYDLFLTEGPQFLPLLLRRLGLLRRDQRTAAIIAGETPYFLRAGRYPKASAAALRRALLAYDDLVCVGEMHASLVREAIGAARGPRVHTIPTGIPEERRQRLASLWPDLGGQRLLYIGNIIAQWRAYYKGLDLVIAAAAAARAQAPGLRLEVVGHQTDEVLRACAPPAGGGPWLRFAGPCADVAPALARAAMYVHLSRGDAGPLTVLEAMSAGVPPLVSEWTGLRGAVAEVDPRLVVPLDAGVAAERIRWYLQLPMEQKAALSLRCRQVAARYPEADAVSAFRLALSPSAALPSGRELVYPDSGGSRAISDDAGA